MLFCNYCFWSPFLIRHKYHSDFSWTQWETWTDRQVGRPDRPMLWTWPRNWLDQRPIDHSLHSEVPRRECGCGRRPSVLRVDFDPVFRTGRKSNVLYLYHTLGLLFIFNCRGSWLQLHPWERPKSVTVSKCFKLCHCNQNNFTIDWEIWTSEKCHCNQMALYSVTVTGVTVTNWNCSPKL